MTISRTAIDDYLWRVTMYLAKRHGLDSAYRMVSPLEWYINTGRASVGFLRCLLETRAYLVGRVLAKGGSDDSIIDAVMSRIKAQ